MGYDIDRFLIAQKDAYPFALKEIKNGRKTSHWIWYIFPQLRDLGYSYNARYYGIENIEEAKEYYSHDVLRNHLIEISEVLYALDETNIIRIVGDIDSRKIQSCMTLFLEVDPSCNVFQDILNKYYNGQKDKETINILKGKV